MRRASLLLLLLAHAACKKTAAPNATPSALPSASTTVAPVFGLTVLSEVAAAGVRVATGSLSTRTSPAATPSVWGFTDLGVDANATRLRIVPAPHGAALSQLLPADGLAVVNGGYFEPDFRPSTWLKDAGIELSPKADTSKGGVLAVGAGRVYLGPFAGLSFDPELAVQSFPLIVEPAGKPGIHRDDGRRAARTVVCLVGDVLHFIVIAAPRGDGPTLFETASLARDALPRGFGCGVALNLDGGPSTGVWFGPRVTARQRPPFANVGYAIAIVPR